MILGDYDFLHFAMIEGDHDFLHFAMIEDEGDHDFLHFAMILGDYDFLHKRVYETRTATPARTSSGIPQSRSCFRTLPLMYHPEGQNKAPYNSEIPENDILTLKPGGGGGNSL